ncbi:unnamed protein product [Penicillium manginii]
MRQPQISGDDRVRENGPLTPEKTNNFTQSCISEIDWDGPTDPENPVNWSRKKKWLNMFSISFLTLLTPLTSSIVAPAQGPVMKEFQITSRILASFVVSIYLVGFAFGPLFLAPLSEIYGRLRIYQIGTFIFVIWNVAGALAPNIGALLAFRLLAGISGSSPITLGAGSIADMFALEERGLALSIYGLGPLLGPIIGPIAGGFLSEARSWRWIFWLLTIVSGVGFIMVIVLQSETYEPVLLRKRADRVKRELGHSNVYETTYGFSQGATGLVFISIGVGSLFALVFFGLCSDKLQNALIAKNDGQAEPEFRLPPSIPGSFLIPVGLFWYGWSAEMHVHWIMPIIGLGLIGFGMIASLLPFQAYLVDSFGKYAASAIAANTVFRSLVGAFLPLAGSSINVALANYFLHLWQANPFEPTIPSFTVASAAESSTQAIPKDFLTMMS